MSSLHVDERSLHRDEMLLLKPGGRILLGTSEVSGCYLTILPLYTHAHNRSRTARPEQPNR